MFLISNRDGTGWHRVPIVDECGKQYFRLTVLGFAEIRVSGIKRLRSNAYWHVACVCGTHKVVAGKDLRQGHVKSCGCWNRERARQMGLNQRGHINSNRGKPWTAKQRAARAKKIHRNQRRKDEPCRK